MDIASPAQQGPTSRPEQVYFDDPAIDRVLGIVMALATEVYVLRDRSAALERQLHAAGIVDPARLDAEPGPEELAAAARDRDAFIAHLLEPVLGRSASLGASR